MGTQFGRTEGAPTSTADGLIFCTPDHPNVIKNLEHNREVARLGPAALREARGNPRLTGTIAAMAKETREKMATIDASGAAAIIMG